MSQPIRKDVFILDRTKSFRPLYGLTNVDNNIPTDASNKTFPIICVCRLTSCTKTQKKNSAKKNISANWYLFFHFRSPLLYLVFELDFISREKRRRRQNFNPIFQSVKWKRSVIAATVTAKERDVLLWNEKKIFVAVSAAAEVVRFAGLSKKSQGVENGKRDRH
jgi:hypothetical protein